ncbi:MAG: hybrid sensor histidine kinase/response regulator transcription factor, partial [Bacteroidota bacterium]
GNLYYGGYEGIVSFQPEKILPNPPSRLPYIESFKLFDEVITPNGNNSSELLSERINNQKELILDYRQHTFSFEISTVPFDFPNNQSYRYQLTPWNDHWQTLAKGTSELSFTNVDPGPYTLSIQQTNEEGQWSNSKKLGITIYPPFWEETWFRIAMVVLIVALIASFIKRRLRRVKTQNLLLTQKVNEQTRDLIQKNEQIQQISQKLHESDQAKLRFFTNISHEFRTPLTVIMGYLDNLDHDDSKKTRTTIKNNASRLLRLIDQLIEFRKIDYSQKRVQASCFDLVSFTQRVIDSFQVLARKKNINLSLISGGTLSIWSDRDKLEKVLYNLISNAIKYTDEGRSIFVKLEEEEDALIVSVEDQGMGIKKEDVASVFERFYRGHAEEGSFEQGYGIGLALVKELVTIIRGEITVFSVENEGTTFKVMLKKGNQHFMEEELVEDSTHADQLVERPMHTKPIQSVVHTQQILVVEDNDDLREFVRSVLSEKYAVLTAQDGVEGLKVLDKHLPDLIISDIMMPKMDGVMFCEQVKENLVTSHIPFILLTAKTDKATKIEGFRLGIDDYIEKPFDRSLFLVRVEALLANREAIKKELITLKTTHAVDRSKVSQKDVEFWKKVNQLMQDGISDSDLNMESISEKLYMSRSTFYRKFTGLTGENAADYFRKLRLQKASELLTSKEHTISQVGQMVGFDSPEQFRIKFREAYGVNPSEYVYR